MRRGYDDTIVYFNKTPAGIECPHFYELRWSFGCPFDCQWCYLLGTSFGKKHFRTYDLNTMLRHLARAFREIQEPTIFNSGELSDSYANHPNMQAIMDLFESQSRHKILLLTKTADSSSLARKPRKQVIYSCSLNALPVAARWERLAPSPLGRLKAARQVADAGYEVRPRIDQSSMALLLTHLHRVAHTATHGICRERKRTISAGTSTPTFLSASYPHSRSSSSSVR